MRRDFFYFGGRAHKGAHDGKREEFHRGKDDQRDGKSGKDAVFVNAANVVRLSRSVTDGNDRLRRLPHAVGNALRQHKDIGENAVYGEGGTAEIFHNLIVEKHRQNPHRQIDDKDGEARPENISRVLEEGKIPVRFCQAQPVLFREKMGGENGDAQDLSESRGKSRALYAHIPHEHEKVIPADIEYTARNHRRHRLRGRVVVADKAHEKLSQRKQRDGEFQPFEIPFGERQKRVVRAEQP